MIDFNPEAQFAELNPMNFAERAVRRLNDIWAEVLRIMILSRQFKADPRDALPWLRAIDEMTAELRMVGLTVGMLSPWMTPEPIAMAAVVLTISAQAQCNRCLFRFPRVFRRFGFSWFW